jgi:hypothetical protein
MDPYFPVSSQDAPVYPLKTLASDMALNQEPGTVDSKDPSTGNYDSLPPQVVGDRDMWSLIDQGDVARFLTPAAALENAAGKFVEPTDASMAAAVKDMTVNPDGITRSMNYTDKDPAAYPLTMIVYAVVPTGGISQAKAAAKVFGQVGNPKPQASASTTPVPSAKPTTSTSTSTSPLSSGSAAARSVVVSFSRPAATGMSWVVLALLIAGFALILTGPAALIYGSPAARAAIGSGTRRVRRAGATARNARIRRRNS